ncbi:ferric reductase-like transmembrane domain-containing protein [Merismopedia glauca]|uniref:Iron reductase n=1 Tax=Merismopedia glauca CCAP 1448/3 TaxID=1296344 RepID=A0A2T1C1I6_9CYAN|nr:ferric reductase-like transmembrane domain-containing protein [Merismopedia glauca]PSB02121.1 iron reductase [Merismopedia glauca CCAP 1448/3]
MKRQLITYLAIAAIIYALAIAISLLIAPFLFSNLLGLIALICYALTLVPGIIKAILPQFSRNKLTFLLLKHRRFIGVLTFCLALNHGMLQVIKRHLYLLNLSTYLHYFQGFSMMTILIILTVTSSNEAVKFHKKNWSKIHRLTHLIPLLALWHILDKMSGHWTYLTAGAVMLSTILVTLLLSRQYQHFRLRHVIQ